MDSYFNITIKVIGAFKWASEFCPNVRYILRINDHVVVNTFKLFEYLSPEKARDYRNIVSGLLFRDTNPVRDSGSKYYIPFDEYEFEHYLPYIEGSVYLMSSDLAFNVYNLSTFVYWPRFSIGMEVSI
jgi:hypothetical protein